MFVITEPTTFTSMLLGYSGFTVRAYGGPVPQPTDALSDVGTHVQLASANTILAYYANEKQFRVRLATHYNGSISFVRFLDARDKMLAQYVPNNYATIPVVALSTVRIVIPNIVITVTEDLGY